MKPERFEEVEQLCYDALMLDPTEQKAFLDEACGEDLDLRQQVECLISADARAGEFLKKPLATLRSPASDTSPRKLADYELLRQIGEGGSSTVYLAQRSDRQFEKKVAVKLLRQAMAASAEYQRRFRIERQILADLEHPAITRLLDGGTTEDGSPYVVMEWVDGETIDRYCDRAALGIEERLQLFRKVCQAVQHAHRHLIVHRDLKPSNILVTPAGEPKLLDFGIAKLLEDAEGDPRSEPTLTGRRLLTPQFASPEQIRGERISTASDVYSLGVVLHLLLCGDLPYRLRSRSLDAMASEIESWSPSKRSLTRWAARDRLGLEEICRTRGVSPEQLERQLKGDLKHIVAKALAADSQFRYASVEQLDEDLRRHLAGLPITAREPTLRYRVGKFVRRHRFKLATACGVGLLLTFLAVSLVQQAERTAKQRDKAEAVLTFLRDVLWVADPSRVEGVGANTTLGEALERATGLLDELGHQPATLASLQLTLGTIYSNLGLYDRSEALLSQALGYYRESGTSVETAETLNLLGLVMLHQSRLEEAEDFYQEALDLHRRGSARSPMGVGDSLEGLGDAASLREDLPEAEKYHREALENRRRILGSNHSKVADSLQNLGIILQALGNYSEAEARLRQASALYREHFGENHPHFAINLSYLGTLLFEKGDWSAAGEALERAHRLKLESLGKDHPSTLNTLNALAASIRRQPGKTEAAVELQREVLAGYRSRFDDIHPNVSRSYHNLASALRQAGQLKDAEAASLEALRLAREGLEPGHPNLAFMMLELGQNLLEQNDATAAESLFREALNLRQQGLPAGHWLTAESESLHGLSLARLEQFEEAQTKLRSGWEGIRAVRGEEDERTRIAYERLQSLPGSLAFSTKP